MRVFAHIWMKTEKFPCNRFTNSEIFYHTTNEQVETKSFVVSINKHVQWFQFYYKKKAVDELCGVVDNAFPLFICIDSIRSHRNHTHIQRQREFLQCSSTLF